MKKILLVLCVAMAFAVVPQVNAAVVTWNIEEMDGSQTDAIVRNTGIYKLGWNAGADIDATVNGVLFANAGAVASGSITGTDADPITITFAADGNVFPGADAADRYGPALEGVMDTMLYSNKYTDGAAYIDVTFSGLTVGQGYRVQFLMDQSTANDRNIHIVQGDNDSGEFSLGANAGHGISVLATFIADDASMDFSLDPTVAISRSVLNGVAVHAVPVAIDPLDDPAGDIGVDYATVAALQWQGMVDATGEVFTLEYRQDPNWADTATTTTVVDATSPSPITLVSEQSYYWRVTNTGTNPYNGPVWIFTTASANPAIEIHPKDFTYPKDDTESTGNATFTVSAINAVSYQWYKDDTAMSGETSDTLVVAGSLANEGQYDCVVTGAIGTTPATSGKATLMTERMVAEYEFEDDTTDSQGGDNDGTAAIAVYTDGVVAETKALLVNSDPNNVVHVPHTYELNTKDFTVSVWAKTAVDSAGAWRAPVSSRQMADEVLGLTKGGYIIYASYDNKWEGWTYGDSGFTSGELGSIVEGEWALVTMTFETTSISDDNIIFTGNLSMYLNGKLQGSGGDVVIGKNNTYDLLIGAGQNEKLAEEPPAVGYIFNGAIDDVRYYSYALDSYAIAGMYVDVMGGSICVEYPRYDISGPDDEDEDGFGDPDCVVDMYDFVAIASEWLDSNIVQ